MSGPPPGLCGACTWVRHVGNRRGSTFFMCGRAADDPRYPRYPALPVLRCSGFEPAEATGDETDAGAGDDAATAW